ncbi:MAG TPA: tetratricopeptide repeat protein [Bacteroidia bacterium]|nr:tetratricopeptide repeat protein [Bacteroidia bacterium]
MLRRVFLILLFFATRLSAQTGPVIDSLENLLANEKNDARKIELYNELAGEYKSIDPYKTREYGDKAYGIASAKNDRKGQANALHKKGLSYYYLDSYDTALSYYRQSFNLAVTMDDSSLVAQAYLAIGNVFRLQGLNDTAVIYLNKALHLYEAANDQKNIAFCYSTIGDTYLFAGEFDEALKCHRKALAISKEMGDVHREAFCYSSIGNNYHMRGNFDSSIVWHSKSIEAARRVNEENIIAGSMGVIADAYSNQYNYPKAIETYLQALDLAEKKQDKHNTAFIYAGMSDIYQRQGDFSNAEKYLQMSISLSKQIGDISRSCNGELTMATLLIQKGDTAEARRTTEDALHMAIENNYPIHEAWAYRIKGILKEKEKQFDEATAYYRKSLEISSKMGDQKEIAETRKHLAQILLLSGKTDEAIAEGEIALLLADTISSPGLKLQVAEILCKAYELKGNFATALSYSKMVKQLGDSLSNAENTKKQTELFLQHQFDKEKEQDRIEQAKLTAAQEARYQQQNIILTIAVIGLFLLSGLVFLIFRGLRQKQKANEIISHQKKVVEEKNQEITDSIYYAKNIQEAMLPTPELISGMFREHFVFFRPRDIVSGDFFWVGQRNGRKYFAVADCTGHGVPGGFMSMLGLTLLNEILDEKNIASPEHMLNELRTLVIQSLNKERKAGTVFTRDGMDIALCCLIPEENKLLFSGANNGLYILRNGELFELDPDKQPIGAHEHNRSFTLKEFSTQPGDVIVAFSDGYPDQFGGEKGKKMMYRNFRQIVVAASAKQGDARVQHLSGEFDRWKSNHAQIDDVCVMGIKI